VIELLLRRGAGGVLVAGCPPRDCWHREGPRWLIERVFHGREAELQARVDRARVRITSVSARERRELLAALRAFAEDIAALDPPTIVSVVDTEVQCEPAFAQESS
jgi:coenzyme F420-reducing hydrogenase delta subunit